MTNPHLTEAELVRFAFLDSGVAHEPLPPHLTDCPDCHRNLDLLRIGSSAMRWASASAMDSSAECLDAEQIAAVAEGSEDLVGAPFILAHLLACARCCNEVASVARLLEAPEIRTAVDQLGRSHQTARTRAVIGGVLGSAVAAALLVVLVGRPSSGPRLNQPVYREESVTGFTAPRLVAPLGNVAAIESFQWTSVPRADRYRITVYGRDGSVVWEALTRDTAIAAPNLVRRAQRDTVLWRVAAHVGWEDRWTASDLSMVTVPHLR